MSVIGSSTTAVADGTGRYSLDLTYARDRLLLLAEMDGYQSSDVAVPTQGSITADFTLKPGFAEAVTVIAEVPLLDTTDDISRIQLSPAQVAVLPTPVAAGRLGGGRFGATFDTEPSSDFYDVNAKVLLKPSNRDAVSLAVYKGSDNLDNSRALSLPTGLLERLAARGIDLAARGIDLSNPTLEISDVRDSGNTGIGLTWSRQWSPRVESHVSRA